jgi:hypothetical protein
MTQDSINISSNTEKEGAGGEENGKWETSHLRDAKRNVPALKVPRLFSLDLLFEKV